MAETLEREDSDFLMLLDDDVEVETESVLRAHQFGRFSRDTGDRRRAHVRSARQADHARLGGDCRPGRIQVGPLLRGAAPARLPQVANLRQTKWMHARLDSDYNGWWMSMIPKTVIKKIGLSLPVFIKWDDSEYGLRARAARLPHSVPPGVALWHVSWLDKDDSQDWQAFFHTRNRIIAGCCTRTQPAQWAS